MEIIEAADITFFTRSSSTCLLACFDFAPCEVAVYDSREDKCQLFTTHGKTDLNRTSKSESDVYVRTCLGAFIIKMLNLADNICQDENANLFDRVKYQYTN